MLFSEKSSLKDPFLEKKEMNTAEYKYIREESAVFST